MKIVSHCSDVNMGNSLIWDNITLFTCDAARFAVYACSGLDFSVAQDAPCNEQSAYHPLISALPRRFRSRGA